MATSAGNALISVFNKAGVAEFARSLSDLGWRIYASGGTADVITASGVTVTDVTELVGGGSILGHRVVTLSREIHAGLLADNSPEQQAELQRLGIPRLDLVCVDMYPLLEAVNSTEASESSVLEKTDIGGPTLLHSAAKGRRIVLCRADQRLQVIEWLRSGKPDEDAYLRSLAAIAEFEVSHYIKTSAEYLGDGGFYVFSGKRIATPKYGENPWQHNAGLYINPDNNDSLAFDKFTLREGSPLSYNNYADIDRLLQTATHTAAGFERNYGHVPPIALGAKHGNICSAAIDEDTPDVIRRMLDGDPRALFGGSVLVNFPLTRDLAEILLTYGVEQGKRLLDIVVAPDVSADAIEFLQRKRGKLRVLTNPELANLSEASLDKARRVRYVRGGLLAQDNYTYVLDLASNELKHVGKDATEGQKKDMLLAWAIGNTSNSNTITIVKNGMLIGNGVGQQDRVSAAELALKKASDSGHHTKLPEVVKDQDNVQQIHYSIGGAAAYSDSFFPFPDGPLALTDAGITAILTTRGSVKDGVVFEAMEKAGVSFYTLPDASARGFYAH